MSVHRAIPAVVAAVLGGALAVRAEAGDWSTSIGTGFFGLNLNGEMGFGTNLFGPIELDDIDLSTSDLSDVAEGAFGLGGFSTNGTWTIFYSAGQLKLEDSGSGITAAAAPVFAGIEFEARKAQLGAEYKFARTQRSTWGILFGADYVKHDYDTELSVGASSALRSIENDWTDAIVGFTNSVTLSPSWHWANQIDAGFGGSEGAYHARTGLNWDAGKPRAWLFSFYADYKKIEFENGSPADTDWYRYDVAEFGPGLGFAYMFGGSAEPMAALPEPLPSPPSLPPPPLPPAPPLDTDGDQVADTADQCLKTPQGDKVDAVGCGYNISLEVLFDTNSAILTSESYAGMNRAATLLRNVPTMAGVIEGHTDSTGSGEYNQRLSEKRARTVADYLIGLGIDPARVEWKGYGDLQPVGDNTTAEGRALNRRVVLHRSDADIDLSKSDSDGSSR